MRDMTKTLNIAELKGTSVRSQVDAALVSTYASALLDGAVFPPVVVFFDGAYHLADGWHRRGAALKVGARTIEAVVHAGSEDDAIWYGLGANRTHGRRLTEDDKKYAILLAMRRWPDKSSTQIAEQIGCAQTYVCKLKEQVSTSANLPDRVRGKDGKSYPARRAPSPAPSPSAYPPMHVKTQAAVKQRIAYITELAQVGKNIPQIAAELSMDEHNLRQFVANHKIPVRASQVQRGARRPVANRIIQQMVMDADHLTADVNLIDWRSVDVREVAGWLASLRNSERRLRAFIKQLVSIEKDGTHGPQNDSNAGADDRHDETPTLQTQARALRLDADSQRVSA